MFQGFLIIVLALFAPEDWGRNTPARQARRERASRVTKEVERPLTLGGLVVPVLLVAFFVWSWFKLHT